jgi:PadR family transcriptional regulator PadR
VQDTRPDDEAQAWRSQLRKGTLELAVLALLRDAPRYGLQLVEDLNARGLGVAEGSIYPLLSRMRAEAKVETEWVDGGVGHARKYYRLTRRGADACAAMLAAWAEFRRAMDRVTGERR